MLKVKTGQKLDSCTKEPSCVCKDKILEGNQKCYFCEYKDDKRTKQPYFPYGESFGGLDRGLNQPQSLRVTILACSASQKTQSLIQSKALTIFNSRETERDKKTSEEKVEASRGWFRRLRERNCLHNVKVQAEVASADIEATAKYTEDLDKIINTCSYIKPDFQCR